MTWDFASAPPNLAQRCSHGWGAADATGLLPSTVWCCSRLPAASVFALCGPKHAQNIDSTSTLCLAWRSCLINPRSRPGMWRRDLQRPKAFRELSISPQPPISPALRCWQCPSPAHAVHHLAVMFTVHLLWLLEKQIQSNRHWVCLGVASWRQTCGICSSVMRMPISYGCLLGENKTCSIREHSWRGTVGLFWAVAALPLRELSLKISAFLGVGCHWSSETFPKWLGTWIPEPKFLCWILVLTMVWMCPLKP